ncbi:iron-containing alcohol dehydrogenase [Geovibrio sp. ADMFC3]
MDNFTLNIPTKIFFGRNQIKVLGRQIEKYGGKRVLICYGSKRIKKEGLFQTITDKLADRGLYFTELGGIEPNPRITSVREGVKICREENIDFILAVGGGSVIDCAKVIAGSVSYDGDPWDFCLRKAAISKALPIGTVLTLAATGSESNGNAVISNVETKQKLPVYSPILWPKFSILDPEYTYSVPPFHTAAGIADIMSHIFEQYFSSTADTFTQDRLAEALLKTCLKYAPVVMENPTDYTARAEILWAGNLALNTLLSLGKEGDWANHAIEHEVSAIFDISHGAGLAVLFPNWMKYVMDDTNADKFYQLAVNVFGVAESSDKKAAALEGIDRLRSFYNSIGMPSKLSETGVEEESLQIMAEGAVRFGEIGTFKKLKSKDVLAILKMAY